MLIHVICGPTAGGKSALALDLAAKHDGVIINADSMQVYKALPVLTAQPTAQEQRQAPHRLYGVLDPAAQCTAGQWRAMAMNEIDRAFVKGQMPIIVGGTGFYIKALMEGLSPMPQIPPEMREKAVALQEQMGNPAFHAALAARDPEMAARLNPNDAQRLIRAWEVLEATGKSLAYWQAQPLDGPPAEWKFEISFVNPEREELHRRCDARFETMIERGAVSEVKDLDALIQGGKVAADAAITNALGFHPLQAWLRGNCTAEQAVAQAQLETRQYAKRQVTWFRNQLPGQSPGPEDK